MRRFRLGGLGSRFGELAMRGMRMLDERRFERRQFVGIRRFRIGGGELAEIHAAKSPFAGNFRLGDFGSEAPRRVR